MKEHVEEYYAKHLNESGFILTDEAKEKYIKFLEKWKELIDKHPEARNEIENLYIISNELINICCINHFSKGYDTGVKVIHNISERPDFLQDEDADFLFDESKTDT